MNSCIIYKYLMFILLILLPVSLFSTEQRVLLSGFTIHEHSKDRFDQKYNGFNYGAGYEYNYFSEYNELYFLTNVLVINDSFKNPQLAIGFGHSYRFDTGDIDISAGLSGFVGLKKIYTDKDADRSGGSYGLTGGVGPVAALYYGKYSINFIYVPGIAFKDFDTTGFLFTYFGYKF